MPIATPRGDYQNARYLRRGLEFVCSEVRLMYTYSASPNLTVEVFVFTCTSVVGSYERKRGAMFDSSAATGCDTAAAGATRQESWCAPKLSVWNSVCESTETREVSVSVKYIPPSLSLSVSVYTECISPRPLSGVCVCVCARARALPKRKCVLVSWYIIFKNVYSKYWLATHGVHMYC